MSDAIESPTWEVETGAWAVWMRAAGRPRSTVGIRTYHVRRLGAAYPLSSPWQLTLDDLAGWLGSHDWSPETRRSHRASLRSFFGWARVTGRIDTSPADLLPAIAPPPGRPRPAPESVLAAALAAGDNRDRLMVSLAAHAGLRRDEIARCHTSDLIRDGDRWALRVNGKGGRIRDVPLADTMAARIRQMGAGYLFPGKVDGHLSAAYVGKRMSRLLGPGWTAHTLRHRFASMAYAGERDLRAVQALLGHSKPETTSRYTAIPEGAMRAAATFAQQESQSRRSEPLFVPATPPASEPPVFQTPAQAALDGMVKLAIGLVIPQSQADAWRELAGELDADSTLEGLDADDARKTAILILHDLHFGGWPSCVRARAGWIARGQAKGSRLGPRATAPRWAAVIDAMATGPLHDPRAVAAALRRVARLPW